MKRVALAEKTFDVGEYLLHLHRSGDLKTDFAPINGSRLFSSLSQREQEFGQRIWNCCG